jgi:hypothetical protein
MLSFLRTFQQPTQLSNVHRVRGCRLQWCFHAKSLHRGPHSSGSFQGTETREFFAYCPAYTRPTQFGTIRSEISLQWNDSTNHSRHGDIDTALDPVPGWFQYN